MPRSILWTGLVVVCFASGCTGSARHVMQTPEGGVISMPSNSPLNRKKADEMMAKRFPQGYTIEKEEEVVVGQVTTSNNRSDTVSEDLVGSKKKTVGTVNSTVNQRTVETHDRTEYHIAYRRAAGAAPDQAVIQTGLPPR